MHCIAFSMRNSQIITIKKQDTLKHILYILLFIPILMFSQEELKGMVMEANENNEHIPLTGANVFWLDTYVGA